MPVWEVAATHTLDDLLEWAEWWKFKNEQEKKALDKAQRQAQTRRR